MPKCNATLGQIVRRELQRDLVPGQNTDAIAAETAGKVSEDYSFVFQLNAEETARKFLEHGAGNFYAVFFAHKPPGE